MRAGAWTALIQKHRAVERVALDGLEAGVADDAAQLFFGGAVRGAGRADDIFFEHDRTHVVTAEVEAELENLQSLRDPTGLHVLNIVEIEPRDGENLEILDARRFVPSAAAERRVSWLKAPGDESRESGAQLQSG